MKRYLIVFSITLTFIAKCTYAQTPDPVFNQIYNLDFDYYKNKPVGSFINALPSGYLEMKLIGHVKNSHVRCLGIVYPNHVTLLLLVFL